MTEDVINHASMHNAGPGDWHGAKTASHREMRFLRPVLFVVAFTLAAWVAASALGYRFALAESLGLSVLLTLLLNFAFSRKR